MILKKVAEIKDGEVLAEDIEYEGTVLISKGTILKENYIGNLIELQIELVNIEELIEDEEEKNFVSKKIYNTYYQRIRKVIEGLLITNIIELKEMEDISNSITEDILQYFDENQIFKIENRKPDLYKHSMYVCVMSVCVAKWMGLSQEEIKKIALGALLHDIGYRFITIKHENIKEEAMLAGDIFEIKKHTIYGFSIIESQSWIDETSKQIILSHHECIDGSGFPLKQRKIDISVQIVAVCNYLDALLCGNACDMVSPVNALEVLRSCSKKYDKKVINTLLEHVVEK